MHSRSDVINTIESSPAVISIESFENLNPFQFLQIEIDYDKSVNFALQQNKIPFIRRVRVHNSDAKTWWNVTLQITSDPKFHDPFYLEITRIASNETITLHSIPLILSYSFLSGIISPVNGSITALTSHQGKVIGKAQFPIRILPYDQWGGLSSLPELLTAYVIPNHPVIQTILKSSSHHLKRWTGDSAITAYQRTDRKRVYLIAASIFYAIQEVRIRYATTETDFELNGQKIRLPDKLTQNLIGNCLDVSLLFAGCLEAAGLNSLLLITQNHAFSGVWLKEDTFSDVFVDDILPIKKRIDIDEICIFDSISVTLDTPFSFEEAIKSAKGLLNRDKDFCGCIDVRTARSGRYHIIPIPCIVDKPGSDEQVTEIIPPEAYSPPSPKGPEIIPGSLKPKILPDKKFHPVIDRWMRNLLDLTLKNHLLNFPKSGLSIPLDIPDIDTFEDLFASGKSFSLKSRYKRSKRALESELEFDNQISAFLSEELNKGRIYADLSEKDLDNKLSGLYKQARRSIEESGAETLYLALGIIQWFERSNPDVRLYAPIILIPLKISKKSTGSGFEITQGDDEPRVNETLLERLKIDYNLEVPCICPIPSDGESLEVNEIITRFRMAIRDLERWDVTSSAYISHFSFSKYLMWRDLYTSADILTTHPFVAFLTDPVNNPVPDTDVALDHPDDIPPDEIFCPLSYDSSQLAAVFAAGQGCSFVLHGPPGTGKSQTITNIIAHCLALGKTVLFISEKKVALEVVYSRLKECGLSPFCLELHSDRSNKAEILNQFEQTLVAHTERRSDEWSLYAAHLADIRNGLNAYVRAMHAVRNTGESVYQGLIKLIGLRNCEYLSLPWNELTHISDATLINIERTVHQIELITSQISHPSVHPFSGSCCNEWSPTWAVHVEEALKILKNNLEHLLLISQKLWILIGIDPEKVSEKNITSLPEIMRLLSESGLLAGTNLICYPDYDSITENIHLTVKIGRNLNRIRGEINSKYYDSVYNLDFDEIKQDIEEIPGIFFLKRRSYTKGIISRIQPYCKTRISTLDAFYSDIEDLILVKSHTLKLSERELTLKPVIGPLWNDTHTDWNSIEQALVCSDRIRSIASDICNESVSFPQVIERLNEILQSIHSDSDKKKKIIELVSQYEERLSSFNTALSNVISILEISDHLYSTDLNSIYLKALRDRVDLWLEHKTSLKAWCQWNHIKKDAIEKGFSKIIELYESSDSHQISFSDLIYRSFYQWWVNSFRETDPDLKRFFRPQYEDMIKDFKETDEALLTYTRREIKSRLFSRLGTKMDTRESSEMGILRHQIQMQRRHMPVRSLIKNISNILPKIKPCLLMSPVSVAQYLEPGVVSFDVVIFDEASQIPISDAIGPISRGKSTIIVGDPKQLPPTNMFRRMESSDPDEYDYCSVELDSILDECIASAIKQKHLSWHYRSRHESLIAFSNYHFYKNSLQTFPSPGKNPAVSLIHINGTFDSGKTRTNTIEAEAVTDEVIRRFLDPLRRDETIGIITFNEPQQDLIQEMLDKKLRNTYEISRLRITELYTSLFVKNLENVQGDERDVIFFSIGYGPNFEGNVSMNFGPLNRDGGERRLNVAITRARKEVVVFSSLKPEMIDLSRTQKRGVLLLKSFLESAGDTSLAHAQTCPGYSDPQFFKTTSFEEEILSMLNERGYYLNVKVGCSDYRIDIAVIHPDIPDYYILGIICDNDNRGTSNSARDRDILRIKVLTELGWNIHRVWSVDWWDDPALEISRIEGIIQTLREEYSKDKMVILQQEDSEEIETDLFQDESVHTSCDSITPDKSVFVKEEYLRYSHSAIIECTEDFTKEADDNLILSVISGIIQTEGPVSFDLLLERLSEYWHIHRKTSSIKEKVRILSESSGSLVTDEDGKEFFWPPGVDPLEYRRYRTHKGEDPWRRRSDDIPSIEIQNAVRDLLNNYRSLQRKNLLKKTATIFGFKRLTPQISKRLSQSFDILISKDMIKQEGDFLIPCPEQDPE